MGLRPVLMLSKFITVDHMQLMLVSSRALFFKALVLKLNYKYILWKTQIEEVFFTVFFLCQSLWDLSASGILQRFCFWSKYRESLCECKIVDLDWNFKSTQWKLSGCEKKLIYRDCFQTLTYRSALRFKATSAFTVWLAGHIYSRTEGMLVYLYSVESDLKTRF